jgi:hypothetical protein
MNAKELTKLDFVFDLYGSLEPDENDDVLIKKNVKVDYTIYNKLVQIAASEGVTINELLVNIYMLYCNEYITHNSRKNDYFND